MLPEILEGGMLFQQIIRHKLEQRNEDVARFS
jgi:hypothetical protein